MADGKGFGAILKLAVPPSAEYHSGASLILQGDSLAEVQGLVDEYVGEEVGATLIRDIVQFNLPGAVGRALQGESAAEADEKPKRASGTRRKASEPEEAAQPVTGDSPASEVLLKTVAKKTGKDIDELKGLTTEQAKTLLKEAKK
jgi:hypothetical protein